MRHLLICIALLSLAGVPPASAGPILQPLAEPLSGNPQTMCITQEGEFRILVESEEGFYLLQSTPDGGWGNLGVVLDPGLDSVSLHCAADGLIAVWRDEAMFHAAKLVGVATVELAEIPVTGLGMVTLSDGDGAIWAIATTGGALYSLDAMEWTEHESLGEVAVHGLFLTPTLMAVWGDGVILSESGFEAGAGWTAGGDVGPGVGFSGCATATQTYGVVTGPSGEQAFVTRYGAGQWTPDPDNIPADPVLACSESAVFYSLFAGEGQWDFLDPGTGHVAGVVAFGVTPGAWAATSSGLALSGMGPEGDVYLGHLDLSPFGPPQLAGVSPNPALAGQEVAVHGFRVAAASTAYALDGVSVLAAGEEAYESRFFLDEETLGGEHEVSVSSGAGQDFLSFSVLAVAPNVVDVDPDPMKLGALVVVTGKHLEQVHTARVGGMEQEVSTADPGAVVFTLAPETPVGSQLLEVESPTGVASKLVAVVLPAPEIVKATPNPVRRAQYLTVTGLYLENLSLVSVGGQSQPIMEAGEGSVTVHLSESTPLGEQMVLVTGEGGTSMPSGPIKVLETSPDVPLIEQVHPVEAAPGLEVEVRGEHLDEIDEVTIAGVTAEWVSDGETKARLRVPEVPDGDTELRYFSAHGVRSIFMTVLGSGLPNPVIESVSPDPVQWGNVLTIDGEGLVGVWEVWVGKTVHLPLSVSDTEVTIEISEDTVGGPQDVVAVGAGLSNALEVMIALEAPAGGESVEDVPDVTDSPEEGGEDVSEPSVAEEPEQGVTEPSLSSESGCRSMGGNGAWLGLLIVLLLWRTPWSVNRRSFIS